MARRKQATRTGTDWKAALGPDAEFLEGVVA